MVKPIEVEELLSLADYEKARLDLRRQVLALRKQRRVPIGNRLSFVFECRETVLFQLYETMRSEGIADKAALGAECAVYNAMLPTSHELSATLVIDLPEGANVRQELQRLAGIESRSWLVVGEERLPARFEVPTGPDPIAPNQHIRFLFNDVERRAFQRAETPVLLKIEAPNYNAQTAVVGETRRLLGEDLS